MAHEAVCSYPNPNGHTVRSAGETNQWYPELIEDNHFVDQPYAPEEGYHLSKDFADRAISFIRDSKQSRPDKPWYMWSARAPTMPRTTPAGLHRQVQGRVV